MACFRIRKLNKAPSDTEQAVHQKAFTQVSDAQCVESFGSWKSATFKCKSRHALNEEQMHYTLSNELQA